ncbi:MAG: 5-methyltetrahydropteroyltriglutamate--homocysteine S-methyltransferase [Solirubrobacterales bacterium]
MPQALSNVLGFPRIGAQRELKSATEAYWAGDRSLEELAGTAKELRAANWKLQRDAGIDLIPSNDFSLYDQVLDTIAMVGAVPERYGWDGSSDVDQDTYFAMARGRQTGGVDVTAMEMTKWFDTNYHYIVPELERGMRFRFASRKPLEQYAEAKEQGIQTKPVLIGPLTFLLQGKCAGREFDRLELLDSLVDVYAEVLAELGKLGAEWVQIDEPVLVEDRSPEELEALERAYRRLGSVDGAPRIVIATYFDHIGESYPVLTRLPVAGVSLDFVYGPHNHELIQQHGWPEDKTLLAGVVNGRNVWINDLSASLDLLEDLYALAGERLVVSSSCSLLHSPIDKRNEPRLDDEVLSWMSFASQKLDEVAALTRGLNEGREAISAELDANAKALEDRRNSPRTRNPAVRERLARVTDADAQRQSGFSTRRDAQHERLGLPLFPTTTIGSFPQTSEIRTARMRLRKGEIDESQYLDLMRNEVERVIRLQEAIGLDVLVHGEPERNDMVQYFAEQMDGYVFTDNAWVQSYGSRYVRPPIIFGDVSRPNAMTVDWIKYAQSLTDKHVKGMLTGPVTMLMWSFVRDDQPRSETCKQLALAIRDETSDLEAAGVEIIQVDEPAIREGLPLRSDRWDEYLDWAVYCFRLTVSSVRDETQIQTHMCYSEFGDIMRQIQEMDADVLLIEAARSKMELLEDWKRTGYENEIGPGLYDIHSPRIPSTEEMAELLRLAAQVLEPEQIWVDPDCGLKTRRYEEVEPSLKNMVAAAKQLREELVPSSR